MIVETRQRRAGSGFVAPLGAAARDGHWLVQGDGTRWRLPVRRWHGAAEPAADPAGRAGAAWSGTVARVRVRGHCCPAWPTPAGAGIQVGRLDVQAVRDTAAGSGLTVRDLFRVDGRWFGELQAT